MGCGRIFCVIASGLLFAGSANADACFDRLAREAEGLKSAQDAAARAAVGTGVAPKMASRLYAPLGVPNGKAALVVHGFLASPFEVEELSRALAARGFAVWAPLIEGFGVTADYANRSGVEDWRRTIVNGLDLLAGCYERVAIAGFSLGGGLTADFVFDHPNGDFASPIHPERALRLTSAALLSPYIAASESASSGWARAALDRVAGFWPTLELWKIALFSGSGIRSALLYPDEYLDAMPMLAVRRLLEFGRRFEEIDRAGVVSNVPATLAYSEADDTIDWRKAAAFVARHFVSARTFAIPRSYRVEHQILLPTLNRTSGLLVNAVADRLDQK